MRVLCYDCFSGISGDMNLGAMLDLGIEESYLKSELDKLNLRGWELKVEKAQKHGIHGTKVTVKQTMHEHAHRHLSDIEKIIDGSSLGGDVKELSMKIFRKIAVAEAKVHGIPVEEVHFHEVGAIDSIVDITGAAICFAALNPDAVFVSEIELGSGFVKCDHGNLPVPAPATAEIVKGMPVRTGGVGFEATTPTGAAILSALGTGFGSTQAVKITRTGYGVGHKEHPDIPNLLRVSLGETASNSATGHKALLIESNIDDMNPEFYDHISERLFKAGASDVYFSQIIMKKGRPGVVLKVICETGIEDAVKDIIFKESTTLGIRIFEFRKETLAREFGKISTVYGEITIKKSFYENLPVSVKPEYEDCKRIASEKGIPVKEVYNHVMGLLSLNKDQI
ncbi:MAG: nickel pincer cofactor biosynthesis protein LarC [Bacteroidales bacterium]|nr:nickel pincer cofactor biosynthesis protein LarC [Bacteroidales bacterium]